METIPFSGSRSFQWKPFIFVEAVLFIGNHLFYWKSFDKVEANPFTIETLVNELSKKVPKLQVKILCFTLQKADNFH